MIGQKLLSPPIDFFSKSELMLKTLVGVYQKQLDDDLQSFEPHYFHLDWTIRVPHISFSTS
jgi:hypothetical protein